VGFDVSVDTQIAMFKSDLSHYLGNNLDWLSLERFLNGIHDILNNIAAFKNRHRAFTAEQMEVVRELVNIGKLLYQRACISPVLMQQYENLAN